MSQYTTGTVNVTNGSATVTGDITKFITESVAAGDIFSIQGEGVFYEIASVNSETQITLTKGYGGTTKTGASYVIARDFTVNYKIPYPSKYDVETASILKLALNSIDDLIHNMDATLLDGLDSLSFLRSDVADTATGMLTLHGIQAGNTLQGTDNVDALSDGLYRYAGQSGLTGDVPLGHDYGVLIQMSDSAQPTQLYFGGTDTEIPGIAVRRADGGVWQQWSEMIHNRGGQRIDGTLGIGSNQTLREISEYYLGVRSGSTAYTGIGVQTSDGYTRGYLYGNNSDQIGLLTRVGQWVVRGATNEKTLLNDGTGTLRTPILNTTGQIISTSATHQLTLESNTNAGGQLQLRNTGASYRIGVTGGTGGDFLVYDDSTSRTLIQYEKSTDRVKVKANGGTSLHNVLHSGDIGTGASQVAAGNHTHSIYSDIKQLDGIQSWSDFVNGTIIYTEADASNANGISFVLKIEGKSYSPLVPPFDVVVQGYIYNGTFTSVSGIDHSGSFGTYVKILEDQSGGEHDGKLAFWFPRFGYWQSFKVSVWNASTPTSEPKNLVTAIGNAAEPASTKKVQVDLVKSVTSQGGVTVDGPPNTFRSGAAGRVWNPNARTSLVIENSNAAGTALSIVGKSSGYSGIFFGDESAETSGQVRYDHTDNQLKFYAAAGDRFTVSSDGAKTWNGTGLSDVVHTGGGQTIGGTLRVNGNLTIDDTSKLLIGPDSGLRLERSPGLYSHLITTENSLYLTAQNSLIFQPSGSASTVMSGGSFYPVNDQTVNLGTPTLRWSSAYIAGAEIYSYLRVHDNDYLYLGTSNDCLIYHDGSNTHINNNTGQLVFDTTSGGHVWRVAGTNEMILVGDRLTPLTDQGLLLGDATRSWSTAYLGNGIVLKEKADHPIATPSAGKGQIWVKNTTPNQLWFTDDNGTDHQLTPSSAGATYEEGTWTPTLRGSGTDPTQNYSSQIGKYVKIGNQVTLHFYVMMSHAGVSAGSGYASIEGVPFTNGSVTYATGSIATVNGWLTANAGAPTNCSMALASNYISLNVYNNNGNQPGLGTALANDVSINTLVVGTMTYLVD